MFEFEELLAITKNKLLFEKISEAKKRFVHIFAEVANQISVDSLSKAHQKHRGIKISKGNELQHCPYQVLDVLRDFDISRGCNIRILHWWGRGLFVLLFFGKNHACLSDSKKLIDWARLHDYQICLSDLWAYGKIIDEKKIQESEYFSPEKFSAHLTNFSHLQLIKAIPIVDMETAGDEIKKEVENILYWMLP
ncbi:hypothetical protein [Cyclobacterium sp.]|uniref:hypothetical protein n=1 Tax=Cyclobacterium sp. TaxID=1966343 RepID=UPI0019933319|nr:hypothetical protein [Cyclobacterium sp.]MBD3627006.1 hypothetical protein [Cyclobacterium sp.]